MNHPTPDEFLAQQTSPEDDQEPIILPPLESIAESLRTIAAALTVEPADPTPTGANAPGEQYDALLHDFEELEGANKVLLDERTEVLNVIKKSTSKLANAVRDVLKPPAAQPAEVDEEDEPHAFVTEDGVDCCRLCGRHENDGQGIHVTDEEGVTVPFELRSMDKQEAEAFLGASGPTMGGFVGMPTRDADVEAWRSYARTRGFDDPAVGVMNRSQIRTMLGVEQPVPTQ